MEATKDTKGRLERKGPTADRLGVSKRTLEEWVRRGLVPHVRLSNRTIRFEVEAIERWIAERRRGE